MSAILRLSGVSKRFGALLAVGNLSMHLNDGEALGVIGPNGSGKTTVFNILSGIICEHSNGAVCANDIKPSDPAKTKGFDDSRSRLRQRFRQSELKTFGLS